jgi:glycosyltransferase involved in cell wall biosynthesis
LFYIRGQICERCKHGNTLHAVRRKCYRESYLLSALYALVIGLHRRWGTFQAIDRFVALTRFTAQKLLESGLATPDKISVLGNFLPDPLPTPGAFEKREPYLVFLGRISPEKGLEILLEAMAGLPHLRLKILGNGPQAQALQILSRERKLHQVEFLGHVTGVKKWELLQRAWATVVPSICYEGFPLAALESLAVGTPVVAARHGSLPWVIENGKSGLLFNPGVAKDLRAKLAWLANNRETALAMGQYARQVAKSRFTAAAHYNGLMRIYQELLL